MKVAINTRRAPDYLLTTTPTVMAAEPLLHWSEPVTEFIGFISLFLANGAVGFRYAAVRDRLTAPVDGQSEDLVYTSATRRAAVLGLIGTLVQMVLLAKQLPELAARMHRSVGGLLSSDPQTMARAVLLLMAIAGFSLAAARRWSAWPVAAVGIIGAQLAVVLSGRWVGLVNPIHQLMASLWLGTLAVVVLAGLSTVLRQAPQSRRGPIAADMVNGFSPLALTCGPLLVLTGVITAVLHLKPFSSLWTTPYGYALLTKLCLVALVFALGAWNWRRQRPQMGSEEAATRIRRSSVLELSIATLVLVATSVLVSLPSPKAPQPAGASAEAGTPGSTHPAEH
jgi:putative copper export protein